MLDSIWDVQEGIQLVHRKSQSVYDVLCVCKSEISNGLMVDAVTLKDVCDGRCYTKPFTSIRMKYDKVG